MMRMKPRDRSLQKRAAGSVRRFAADTSASTAIEYALMTFIAIAIIAAVTQLGGTVGGLYQSVLDALAN
jgi:Flp pilus assembly pilin Flp